MTDNLKLMKLEFELYKGQFVINDSRQIERLVAIGSDEMDYYYVTFDGRDLHWNTGVGRIMPLKGQLRDKDYNHLIYIAKLNHYDQLDKEAFLISFDKYTKEKDINRKYVTDICWDLN